MNEDADNADQELMHALAAGKESALNGLMQRWAPRLSAYLERLTGSHATAADLAQESFVRVFKYRHRFNHSQRFSTWLYAIATNLARSQARWQSRHPETLIEPEVMQSLPVASAEKGPDDALLQRERAERVKKEILNLPAELREPLLLSVYQGLSQVEIADVLSLSPKAVEMRIYRARQSLAASLAVLLEG